MLYAERREPSEIAMTIATNARRLKYQSAAFARNPARRSVEGIALGRFAETRFVIQPHRDIRRAKRMADTASHRGVRRHAQVADSLVVLIPQPALFFAEILKRKNRAEIIRFKRVKHLTVRRATAQT